MAWKMVRTIFPQHSVSAPDRSTLLMLCTAIALDDLLRDGVVSWSAESPPDRVLSMTHNQVEMQEQGSAALVIKRRYLNREIDQLSERAEKMFDHYGFDEVERATLFTALPCLGLHALAEYLEWLEEPPFVELGG